MYAGDGDGYGVNLSLFVHFINEICNGQDSFKVFLLLIMINIPALRTRIYSSHFISKKHLPIHSTDHPGSSLTHCVLAPIFLSIFDSITVHI